MNTSVSKISGYILGAIIGGALGGLAGKTIGDAIFPEEEWEFVQEQDLEEGSVFEPNGDERTPYHNMGKTQSKPDIGELAKKYRIPDEEEPVGDDIVDEQEFSKQVVPIKGWNEKRFPIIKLLYYAEDDILENEANGDLIDLVEYAEVIDEMEEEKVYLIDWEASEKVSITVVEGSYTDKIAPTPKPKSKSKQPKAVPVEDDGLE